MKKSLVTVLNVVVLTIMVIPIVDTAGISAASAGSPGQVAGTTASFPEPPPGAAVFDLKYRGLDAPDDPLSYRSYWGFGAPSQTDDPFVAAVKSQVSDCTPVYNGSLPEPQWSVVELKDKKPVAFYFDVNADGKLSDNEKFLPAAPSGPRFSYPHAFVTSDFLIQAGSLREIPFRVLLVGYPSGNDRISYMWSPSCVLEGQGTLAGKLMKLVLYGNGFSGSFTEFGRGSITLVPAQEKLQGYVSRSTLSSLILHEGTFYRLRLYGTHAKDSIVRVVIEKDTAPTGQVAIDLAGQENLKARLVEARLEGAKDSTVHLYMPNAESTLPVGQYKLPSGYVNYGLESNDQWRVNFSDGPQFEVKTAETSQIDLGRPALSISAVDEKERYQSDVKERSTYAKGTSVYLAPKIKGKAGEVYMRFSQKTGGSNNMTDIKPHVAILDSDGKQVASADMEYG